MAGVDTFYIWGHGEIGSDLEKVTVSVRYQSLLDGASVLGI